MLKVLKYLGSTSETDNNFPPWLLTAFLPATVTKIMETKNTQLKKITFKELFTVKSLGKQELRTLTGTIPRTKHTRGIFKPGTTEAWQSF